MVFLITGLQPSLVLLVNCSLLKTHIIRKYNISMHSILNLKWQWPFQLVHVIG